MALLCVQLDFFSLSLALPTIASSLGVAVTDLQWLVSGYLLSLGALLVPAGRVGDIVGRKLTLVVGLVIFAVTSLICGATSDIGLLIGSRVTQGVGAALIMPTVFALVANDSEESERPKIVGFLLGIAGVGTALGPIVGGVFASTVGWQWVFWINVPLAVIALLGVLRVKDSRNDAIPRSARSMDWWGLVTVVIGLASLSVGIDQVSDAGWLAPSSIGPIIVGVLLLASFALVESRVARPLVNPSLLRIRPFTLLLIIGLVCNVGLNVFVFMATIDLQNVRGEAAQTAGLLFILGSVGVALAGPIGGWLCSRFAAALVLGVSAVLGAISLVMIAEASSLWLYVLVLGLGGVTCGMSYSVTQVGVQTAVPVARNSEANSFLLMALIAIGGVAVVISSGIVEAIGGGRPTAGGVDAVLIGMAAIMALAGVVLLLFFAGHRRDPAFPRPAATAAAEQQA
jgi:MFS family permease